MDKYSIKRKIDGGNQGAIYLGSRKDETNDKMYAVKQIDCNSTEELERVQREINLVLNLDHPNVVKHYESLIEEKEALLEDEKEYNVYIVMDYCSGGNLENILTKAYQQHMGKSQDASISLGDEIKIKWTKQILDVLQYLKEKNIIHRDIKPDNILFQTTQDSDLNTYNVRVCDFGFTKDLAGASTTNTFVGTPVYMPPEILARGKYDHSADIWSLGVLILQMLLEVDKNHVPDIRFEVDKDPNYITNLCSSGKIQNPNLPKIQNWNPTLVRLASLCCKIDPKDRATPTELLKIIEEAVPVPSPPVSRQTSNLTDRPHSLTHQQTGSVRKNPLINLMYNTGGRSSANITGSDKVEKGRQRSASAITPAPAKKSFCIIS